MDNMVKLMCTLGVVLVIVISLMAFDNFFINPKAADKANEECKMLGFDQYKEFSRIGLFSTKPVAIKCEYAEKYTDLGVRTGE